MHFWILHAFSYFRWLFKRFFYFVFVLCNYWMLDGYNTATRCGKYVRLLQGIAELMGQNYNQVEKHE